MKIAFIGPRGFNYPAGIDRVVTELAIHLADRGHKVTFYHRKKGQDISPNLICRHIPTLHTKHLETPIYACFATLHAVFQGFDVIHFQGLGSAWCVPLVRLFTRAKIVTTIHALDWEGRRWNVVAKKILKLSAKIAIKFSHIVTTVSQSNLGGLAKLSKKQIHVVHNGISIPALRTAQKIISLGLEKHSYILFLGRLTPGKGCEYLIQAYSDLNKEKKLVIAGDTIHDHDYVKRLKKMSHPETLFPGWVEGDLKEELLSNAYLFVQPSDLEGLSGTTLEAMSHGLCVVASDLPSNKEALQDSGIYFKCGSAAELNIILKQLIQDPNQVKEKGRMAREIVEQQFSWGPIVDQLEKLYE